MTRGLSKPTVGTERVYKVASSGVGKWKGVPNTWIRVPVPEYMHGHRKFFLSHRGDGVIVATTNSFQGLLREIAGERAGRPYVQVPVYCDTATAIVRFGPDGFTVRPGWMKDEPPSEQIDLTAQG